MKASAAVAFASIALAVFGQATTAATKSCHVGAYRLSNDGIIDIAPSDGDALRWTLWSGETGKLHPKPGGA